MLVRCPNCKTTYKVADELVRGTPPAFRCSRCKHTFEIDAERADGKPAARPGPHATGTAPEELTFTFPAHEPEPPSNAPQTELELPRAAEASSPEDAVQRSTLRAEAFPGRDETNPTPPEAENGDFPADDRSPAAERGPSAADNVLAFEPHRAQPASVVPYLTLFVLLIVAFGLLTAFHHVHPGSTERLFKNIPFLGGSVFKNNHLKSGVDLQSLRASYQTIQGPREVFIVTGVAVNLNSVVIRDVRVAGRLYNEQGAEIDEQTIWIGNAISPKIIRGMTPQDIADLQRLRPLKTFDIPPGDSVAFTIVFVKAPKGVKDFACEVLSAEAQT